MVVVFDQTIDAVERVVRQTVHLESGFRTRPAAAQIVMRGLLEAQTAIECRIAQRYNGRITELIERIQPFIDQLARQPLPAIVFIHRQRCHTDPPQIFALNDDRTEGNIAHHLTFVIGGNQPQRDQAVFTEIVDQLGFRIALKSAA